MGAINRADTQLPRFGGPRADNARLLTERACNARNACPSDLLIDSNGPDPGIPRCQPVPPYSPPPPPRHCSLPLIHRPPVEIRSQLTNHPLLVMSARYCKVEDYSDGTSLSNTGGSYMHPSVFVVPPQNHGYGYQQGGLTGTVGNHPAWSCAPVHADWRPSDPTVAVSGQCYESPCPPSRIAYAQAPPHVQDDMRFAIQRNPSESSTDSCLSSSASSSLSTMTPYSHVHPADPQPYPDVSGYQTSHMNVPVPHHMTTSPANYHTPLPPQPTRPLLGPWDTYYAQPEPQQAHIPTENICLYDGCGALLHDPSCSGVRRHLRDCHFRGHPPSSKALVPCRWGGGCRSEPMQWENLGKHIAECHIKSMKRVCAVCGGCFARSDTLKRHSQSGGCAQRARV